MSGDSCGGTDSDRTIDVKANNSVSTGIFSIPPEILSAIIESGKNMTDDDPLHWESRRKPEAFELVVSHTCLLLRDVALTTPTLWTSIQIGASRSIECISEYIRRSGACWLDIRIEITIEDCQTDDRVLDSMVDLIIPHSLRWRSLSVWSSCERPTRPMIARICDTLAPGLQHLSIQLDDVEQADADAVNRTISSPHIFKEGTPRLKFIRLRGLSVHLFRPPLDAVVILHLDHTRFIPLSYATFRGVITRSPSLAHLSVHGDVIGDVSWPGRANIIHLPNLLSLRICGEGGEIYPGILLGIEAPLLTSLTLKDLQEHDLDPLWDLADAARYANLKDLVFSNFELSNSTYERMSHTFEEIVSFSAVDSSITESPLVDILLRGMVQGQNGPFIAWPRLGVLAFSFDDDETDKEVIQKLVEVRKIQGLPLSKILFRIDPDEWQEVPEIIEVADDVVREFFSLAEPWPPNSNHFDKDDILFL